MFINSVFKSLQYIY